MTLRLGVLIFGGLLLELGLLCLTRPPLWGVAVYLGIYGLVIVCGILFERSHYRPRIDRTRGTWQSTGERFVDPATGVLTEVRFNPATGQRDYVPVGPPGPRVPGR